jgi:prolyl-tRNA editing enzyme YbaK/EbsC (Cys-tRNA(Pro) deacylase)
MFGIDLFQKPENIHTADATKVTGIKLKRVTKNLVCKTNEVEYVLLIIPGELIFKL